VLAGSDGPGCGHSPAGSVQRWLLEQGCEPGAEDAGVGEAGPAGRRPVAGQPRPGGSRAARAAAPQGRGRGARGPTPGAPPTRRAQLRDPRPGQPGARRSPGAADGHPSPPGCTPACFGLGYRSRPATCRHTSARHCSAGEIGLPAQPGHGCTPFLAVRRDDAVRLTGPRRVRSGPTGTRQPGTPAPTSACGTATDSSGGAWWPSRASARWSPTSLSEELDDRRMVASAAATHQSGASRRRGSRDPRHSGSCCSAQPLPSGSLKYA
jgi:hypothetical protein